MTETTATNPELVADQVSQLLVQPFEAASVVLSSGPRIFDTAGVLRIPKLTKSSTVGFVGENDEIPSDHDTTFDEVILMPTDRKSIRSSNATAETGASIGHRHRHHPAEQAGEDRQRQAPSLAPYRPRAESRSLRRPTPAFSPPRPAARFGRVRATAVAVR